MLKILICFPECFPSKTLFDFIDSFSYNKISSRCNTNIIADIKIETFLFKIDLLSFTKYQVLLTQVFLLNAVHLFITLQILSIEANGESHMNLRRMWLLKVSGFKQFG